MLRLLLAPRLIGLHFVAVAAVAAAGWLGLWQYDAWQSARAAEARDLANAEPKALEDVMSADDPFPGDARGQPVRFAGRWLGEGSFLVAGRELDGRSGYWAVSPIAVCDAGCADSPAILVVRGWSPRADLPAEPVGRVWLTGWLQPPDDSGPVDADPGDDVLPELSTADAIQRVDRDLYGGYVIARGFRDGASAGSGPSSTTAALEPVTPGSLPEPRAFTSLRNLLYALEWWVFSAFALFLWWRWCRDLIEAEHGDGGGSPAASGDGTPLPNDQPVASST